MGSEQILSDQQLRTPRSACSSTVEHMHDAGTLDLPLPLASVVIVLARALDPGPRHVINACRGCDRLARSPPCLPGAHGVSGQHTAVRLEAASRGSAGAGCRAAQQGMVARRAHPPCASRTRRCPRSAATAPGRAACPSVPACARAVWNRESSEKRLCGSWAAALPRCPHEHGGVGGGPPAPAVGQVPADVRGNARGLRSLPRADAALPATRRRCSAPDAADQGIIPTQRSPSRRAPQPAAGAHPRCARPQVRPVPPRQTRGCQRPHGDGARRLPALSLSIADAHAARGRAALAWRLRTRLTGDADAAVLGKLRSLRGGCGLSPRAGTPPAGVRSLSSTG